MNPNDSPSLTWTSCRNDLIKIIVQNINRQFNQVFTNSYDYHWKKSIIIAQIHKNKAKHRWKFQPKKRVKFVIYCTHQQNYNHYKYNDNLQHHHCTISIIIVIISTINVIVRTIGKITQPLVLLLQLWKLWYSWLRRKLPRAYSSNSSEKNKIYIHFKLC